ncbi:MAG: sigma-54-dependent Fis family transcriptional regulator [Deltaproteobacteria bacterium]|nr:sigma-54-dependent Fis family transcriptional regulator [Deltaproteobacteria bacterium]
MVIVDDEKDMCDLVVDFLGGAGYEVEAAHDGREALEVVKRSDPDVVITDLRMPDVDGMDLLATLRSERPEIPVIMVTAFGSIDRAIEAMRAGAFYFVTKPFKLRELEALVAKAVEQRRLMEENRRLRREVQDRYDFKQIVGHSKAMTEVFRLVRLVADSASNVLILGASGTGKELVARAIHYSGPRATGPFVPINCSAIPEGLLESELFGHTRGAFTGAYQARRGLFVEASGGTLFLDEIGDMGLGLQAKLLRVLQDRVVRPIGGNKASSVDARVIVATNRDLKQAVKEGTFREDLYYRLSVLPVRLPLLSERVEDIPLLVDHFLRRHAENTGTKPKRVTPRAMDALQRRAWDGNVRELENIMERLCVLTRSDVLDVEDLPVAAAQESAPDWFGPGEFPTLRDLERRYVERVLAHMGGNKDRAARVLGVNRRTLYRMQDRWVDERR